MLLKDVPFPPPARGETVISVTRSVAAFCDPLTKIFIFAKYRLILISSPKERHVLCAGDD